MPTLPSFVGPVVIVEAQCLHLCTVCPVAASLTVLVSFHMFLPLLWASYRHIGPPFIPSRHPCTQPQGLSLLALPEMQPCRKSSSPQESPQTLGLRHVTNLTGASIPFLLESLDGPTACIATLPSSLFVLSSPHCGWSAHPVDNVW